MAAYLEAAEVMQTVKAEGDYGDLLLPESPRCAHWGEYLARRLDAFADDAVIAANVPGYGEKVARMRAQVMALPDPEKCIVHGDIWPPNVMMDDALRVTGLLDFSFASAHENRVVFPWCLEMIRAY